MDTIKLSAIILSRTGSEQLFEMTKACINTLKDSLAANTYEIIVIESNKSYHDLGFKYDDDVSVIIPQADFNFHKFLNIGIDQSKGDYLALLNNDLVFHKDWFTEIMKVQQAHPEIYSFSPNGNKLASPNKDFDKGYKVRTHIFGWCIVVKKEVFKKIGPLDEQFDFNYADNDYALTLKKYSLSHAVVYQSHVEHLDKRTSTIDKGNWYSEQQQLAAMMLKAANADADASDKKSLYDRIKFHKKWGSPKLLHRKNKIADYLIKYRLGYFNRFIMSL